MRRAASKRSGGSGAAPRLPDLPAIDGLRALSVIAVLIYHAGSGWLDGGFLGVEVFFVISGYLITSLLVAEYAAKGGIDLKRFWLGRARRLLPALFAVLLVTALYCVLFLPEEVARLRNDTLAALAYATNWYLIFSEQSYFEAIGRPSLLRHLWSLAIEEQFYILWPLIVSGGLALAAGIRRYSARGYSRRGGSGSSGIHSLPKAAPAIAVAALALGSAALAAYLYEPGSDPSRIYYGTDTRAAALLTGALLALVWHPVSMREGREGYAAESGTERHRGGSAKHRILGLAGVLSLAALVALCFLSTEDGPFLYRGGFLVVSAASAILIAVLASPSPTLARSLLGTRPLRWVGLRSYGIYLWHWPVYMVMRPGIDIGLQGLPAFGARLAVTLTLAALSYRYLEMPIRGGAIGRVLEAARDRDNPRRGAAGARLVLASTASLVLVAALAIPMADAEKPRTPEYLTQKSVNTAGETGNNKPSTPLPENSGSQEGERKSGVSVTGIADARSSSREGGSEDVKREAGNKSSGESEPSRPEPPRFEEHAPEGPESAGAIPRGDAAPDREPQSGIPAGDGGPKDEQSGDSDGSYAAGDVTAIGDSVMVGAAPSLTGAIEEEGGTLGVRASVGMQAAEAVRIMQQLAAEGAIGEAVVVHIGNNGTVTEAQIEDVIDTSLEAGAERVLLVNVKVPRSWEAQNNEVLRAAAQEYPQTRLVDWRTAGMENPGYFYGDGIHLNPQGQDAYQWLILERLSK